MSRDTKAGPGAERFKLAALMHIDALYRLALCAIGNENDAQELVRNTYLKAYKSFSKSEIRFSFKTWLFWILYDIIMNAVRHDEGYLQMISPHEAEEEKMELSRDANREENNLEISPDHDAIATMSDLPAGYGIVILLADVEGLSHKEIAYIAGCSEETVAYRLCKGRRLFRKGLQSQDLQGIDVAAG